LHYDLLLTHLAFSEKAQLALCKLEASGNLVNMTKRIKTDKGSLKIVEVTGLPEKIWSKVGSYKGQQWGLPSNMALLGNLIGAEKTTTLYIMNDSAERNIHLRTLLIKPLKSKNPDVRLAAIRWIVYSWGRVRGKRGKEESWVSELRDYQPTVVDSFIKAKGKDRVASWSKVLGFADSNKYAIYDARVAMSLNAILDDIGHENRFVMPPPSAGDLPTYFTTMKAHVKAKFAGKRPMYYGYTEYMDLLRDLVAKGLAKNVLDAEMRLFASSDTLSQKYASKYNL
jgi:hypothetical protein